jgi:hypothetical protein
MYTSEQTSTPASQVQGVIDAIFRLFDHGEISELNRPFMDLSLLAAIAAHGAFIRMGENKAGMVSALRGFIEAPARALGRNISVPLLMLDAIAADPTFPGISAHEVETSYCIDLARRTSEPYAACLAWLGELACWSRECPGHDFDFSMELSWSALHLTQTLGREVGVHAVHEFIAWLDQLGRSAGKAA